MNWKTSGFLLLESMMVHVPVVIPSVYNNFFCPLPTSSGEMALDLPRASSVVMPLYTQEYKGTEGQFVLNRIKFYETCECACANEHAGGEAATCPWALPVTSTDTDVSRAMCSCCCILIVLPWFWCPPVISWLSFRSLEKYQYPCVCRCLGNVLFLTWEFVHLRI